MSEAEAWKEVYRLAAVKRGSAPTTVCLTGFSGPEREELISLAAGKHYKFVEGVSKKLSFLCVGSEPGPSKLAKAIEFGTPVIDAEQLRSLLADGIIPKLP